MVREGVYYGIAALILTLVVNYFTRPKWAAIPALIGLFLVWFFRDPRRKIPTMPGAIVSPADGKITDISQTHVYGPNHTRISIFLNIFNVHVNRSPIGGMVTRVDYRKGRFGNAMSQSSAEDNEQNVITVEGEGQKVIFKQIAGILARRIVFNKIVGDRVARGERVGLIKFGSRVDVIIDSNARLQVNLGDRVKGGSTILAIAPVARHSVPAKDGAAAQPLGEPVRGMD